MAGASTSASSTGDRELNEETLASLCRDFICHEPVDEDLIEIKRQLFGLARSGKPEGGFLGVLLRILNDVVFVQIKFLSSSHSTVDTLHLLSIVKLLEVLFGTVVSGLPSPAKSDVAPFISAPDGSKLATSIIRHMNMLLASINSSHASSENAFAALADGELAIIALVVGHFPELGSPVLDYVVGQVMLNCSAKHKSDADCSPPMLSEFSAILLAGLYRAENDISLPSPSSSVSTTNKPVRILHRYTTPILRLAIASSVQSGDVAVELIREIIRHAAFTHAEDASAENVLYSTLNTILESSNTGHSYLLPLVIAPIAGCEQGGFPQPQVDFIATNVDSVADMIFNDDTNSKSPHPPHLFPMVFRMERVTRKPLFRNRVLPRWIHYITCAEEVAWEKGEVPTLPLVFETISNVAGLEAHVPRLTEYLFSVNGHDMPVWYRCMTALIQRYGSLIADYAGERVVNLLVSMPPSRELLEVLCETSRHLGRAFHLTIQDILFGFISYKGSEISPWTPLIPAIVDRFEFDPWVPLILHAEALLLPISTGCDSNRDRAMACLKAASGTTRSGCYLGSGLAALDAVLRAAVDDLTSPMQPPLSHAVMRRLAHDECLDVLVVRSKLAPSALNTFQVHATGMMDDVQFLADLYTLLHRLILLDPATYLPTARQAIVQAVSDVRLRPEITISKHQDVTLGDYALARGSACLALLSNFPLSVIRPWTGTILDSVASRLVHSMSFLESSSDKAADILVNACKAVPTTAGSPNFTETHNVNVLLMIETVGRIARTDPDGFQSRIPDFLPVLLACLQDYRASLRVRLGTVRAIIEILRYGRREDFVLPSEASKHAIRSEPGEKDADATTVTQSISQYRITLPTLAAVWDVATNLLRELPAMISINGGAFIEESDRLREQLRVEQARLLGVIGAVDPYRMRLADLSRKSLSHVTATVRKDKNGAAIKGSDTARKHQQQELALFLASFASGDLSPNKMAFEVDLEAGMPPTGNSPLSEMDDWMMIAQTTGGFKSDECMACIAMYTILKIVRDPTLESLHIEAISAGTRLLWTCPSVPQWILPPFFDDLMGLIWSSYNAAFEDYSGMGPPSPLDELDEVPSAECIRFSLLMQRSKMIISALAFSCREFIGNTLSFIADINCWRLLSTPGGKPARNAVLEYVLVLAGAPRAELLQWVPLFAGKAMNSFKNLLSGLSPSILPSAAEAEAMRLFLLIFIRLGKLAIFPGGVIAMDLILTFRQTLDVFSAQCNCAHHVLEGLSAHYFQRFVLCAFRRVFVEVPDAGSMPFVLAALKAHSFCPTIAGEVDKTIRALNGDSDAMGVPDDLFANFEPTASSLAPQFIPAASTMHLRDWDNSGLASRDAWHTWMRNLGEHILVHNPNPALAALGPLAHVHAALARSIFNVAFLAFFEVVEGEQRGIITAALEHALSSASAPPEVAQQVLNLAEFFEHEECPLPIDIHTLGAYSYRFHAFAKALYYGENEFRMRPSVAVTESLISINHQMQQPDAAMGLLLKAQSIFPPASDNGLPLGEGDLERLTLHEGWYEKLNRWDEALEGYRRRLELDPQNHDAILGAFRCKNALGNWNHLVDLAENLWPTIGDSVKAAIAPIAASSAWSALRWDQMERFTSIISEDTPDGTFYRAVLAVIRGDSDAALALTNRTYQLIDEELTALLAESYSRAYRAIVRVQNLAELEEAVAYLRAPPGDVTRVHLERLWNSRLEVCQESVEVWQRIIKLRTLAISARDPPELVVRFAKLCQQSNRSLLARECFGYLLETADLEDIDRINFATSSPHVLYALAKYFWHVGDGGRAIDLIRRLIKHITASVTSSNLLGAQALVDPRTGDSHHLLSRCHLLLGTWGRHLLQHDESRSGDTRGMAVGSDVNHSILEHFIAASSYDQTSFKAWHSLAMANQDMIVVFERNRDSKEARPRSNPYTVPAIQSFFKSISLASDSNALQDILRLLTIWFRHGHVPEVNAAINDGFYTIPVDIWLKIIPQLIARIHVPNPQVRRLIHHVLTDIGKRYPHALIMPITVAAKSPSMSRKTSAMALLDRFRMHSPSLIDQAQLISQELIRASILWEEMWHDGLEEASRAFFGDHDVTSMLSILEPLHHMVNKGAETVHERHFLEAHGGSLRQAHELCLRYKRLGDARDISKAWENYYTVSKKISKYLAGMHSISLEDVAPKLMKCRDLDLCVPGSFAVSNSFIVHIAAFKPAVAVIASKQRPRRIEIIGSDGRPYRFLLKGHEDLRQDQRVMQFFDLVNNLLESDAETSGRHLGIRTFSVVPLSQNTGLISWMPHSDTLHSLIKDYREGRGTLISQEHRMMLQFAPDYDKLTVLARTEAFTHAMQRTEGEDLARIFWQRSRNSESWFERRLTFIRSLAVMSMVGYILGLGDRHPSNLMIDRVTGNVIHIDFGDCFEVAMHRDRFPERVPFRLTRMLVNALEVSGVEGSFRTTCEHTMRVLRANRDSLMAVLEAFVYDPLINWRLLTKLPPPPPVQPAMPDLGGADTHPDGVGRGKGPASSNATANFPPQFSSSRKFRKDDEVARWEEESVSRPEMLMNAGALNVVDRVYSKLKGRDMVKGATVVSFASTKVAAGATSLSVEDQVDNLIRQATSAENLCQAYVGWCPFW